MNTHTYEKWLHPDSMQSVVDGRLSRTELAELVSACEQHPKLWKCCAVAFLEEQTLQLELAELAENWPASAADALDEPRACSRRSDSLSGPSPALTRTVQSLESSAGSPRSEQATRRSTAAGNRLNHLAFAASLLLAFSIGWQTCRRFGSAQQFGPAPGTESVGGQQLVAAGSGSPGAERPATLPAARSVSPNAGMQLADAVPAESDSADTAFVGAMPSVAVAADAIEQALTRPEQFVPLDRRIPKPLAELEQRGLVHIESIEGFVPVRLRDGHTAVVPVQQIDLRPVRNAY